MSQPNTLISSVTSGTGYAFLAFALPDSVLSFTLKLAMALPLGLLTGIGTALGSVLVKRLLTKEKK